MNLRDPDSRSQPERVSPRKVVTALFALGVTVFSLIAAINVYPQLRGMYGEDFADMVIVSGAITLFLLWTQTPLDVSISADDET